MIIENKRKADGDDSSVLPPNKKYKNKVPIKYQSVSILEAASTRTSNLFAPIMLLEGHRGEIFTVDFHRHGQYLASSGSDQKIFLWNIYKESENISVMTGHRGAVTELHFTRNGSHMITSSVDKTLGLWDIETSRRIRKCKGHTSPVTSVQGLRKGPQLMCSGSNDSTVKVWDTRKKQPVSSMNTDCQTTAVCFNDVEEEQIFSGGIDNDIKVWDIRSNKTLYTFKGHTGTITGLSLSNDGSYLLSNSMDNTLRIWDVSPYGSTECIEIFTGHQHNSEKNLLRCAWSPDGTKVTAGSADRFVYIWDTTSRTIIYELPGHEGSVNEVKFHPNEPIIASGSSDNQIYIGEID